MSPLGNNDLADLLSNTPAESPPGIYAGGPVYDAVADQSPLAVFRNTASGGTIGTFVAELSSLAATNRFGLYDAVDPSKKVQVFGGSNSAGEQSLVSFFADGTVRVDFVDSGVTGFSGDFGFYVNVYGAAVNAGGDGNSNTLDYTLYTQDGLNPGGAAQAITYRGNGTTQIMLPGFAAGTFGTSHWLIAFEDGLVSGGASDRDYSDLVVHFESLTPGDVRCGNSVVDAGEECDDGNTNNNDGCRNDCTLPRCGDGIVDANEECDDGNTNNNDGCRNDCTLPRCGDGIIDAGEECDDGNDVDDDDCGNNCTVPTEGCRVTGGGVDCFNGIMTADCSGASGQQKKAGGTDTYQFGGQAGAPTGSQPQPFGEWTHHQQAGPDGSFIFHAGTASAPPGTEIDLITCSDPGWCVQARPAPFKQIDFEGVGTFKNMRNPSASLTGVVPGETFHWFTVHIEDLGEPGRNGKQNPSRTCPALGSEGGLADCECADFYHITIYKEFDPSTAAPNTAQTIYEVYGYVSGGNLQIHPPID